MKPRLKSVGWERIPEGLRVVYDWRHQLVVDDSDGAVERLLELLRDGSSTVDELAEALGAPTADIAAALAAFDDYGLIEDGERLGRLSPSEADRHRSNLGFFESFATLRASREDLLAGVRKAHVLVLGTGGLNSTVLPHLCGLGVGRLTLLDRDAVEPANFARQYLYGWSDIGRPKVDCAAAWVRRFDPSIEVVDAITADLDSADVIGSLLDLYRPDVVASGVDHPVEIDDWVNEACVPRGVPFVRGGMWVTQGVVWSVDPGRSGCRACVMGVDEAAARADGSGEGEQMLAGIRLFSKVAGINRGIGPVAGLLGSLAAFEVLRYLTGFEPPAYAGQPLVVDFAAGCATARGAPWPRRADCPVCGSGLPAAAAAAGRLTSV
jgi:molybdopterin/thiamine biosynthesis adenylyltransferase